MKSSSADAVQNNTEIQKLRLQIAKLEKALADQQHNEEALKSMAFIDELTGLYNRRGFLSMADKQFKLFRRNKNSALVFFADVDYLKQINDTLGHIEGDHALIDTANILRQTFRESDVIGRLGGDEFAVLAMVSDTSCAKKLAGRLKERTQAFNKENSRRYVISLSTGIVNCGPEYENSIDDLLSFADKFMYTHKRARKSQKGNSVLNAPSAS
jgi:two-component system cell cycle response regulator